MTTSITIEFSPSFNKKLAKLSKPDPKIGKRLQELFRLFQLDPYHPRLKTHKLGCRLEGRCAFLINQELRIIFTWIEVAKAMFIDVGSHDQVYR